MHRLLLLLLTTALLWLSSSQAAMYRWVDENGVTVYSQTPPADAASTRIAPPPPPAQSEQEAWGRLDTEWQLMQDRLDAKKESKQQQTDNAQRQAKRDRDCQAAQKNLAILQGSPRNRIRTPEGEYRRLTTEEREQERKKAQQVIDEYCSEK